MLSFFTLLLACAVAAQIWVGILLLLDTSDGDVRRFNELQKPAPPAQLAVPGVQTGE
jgi:hypothetical protein